MIPAPIHIHVHIHAAPPPEPVDRFPDPDADPVYWRVTDQVREGRVSRRVGEAKKERGR